MRLYLLMFLTSVFSFIVSVCQEIIAVESTDEYDVNEPLILTPLLEAGNVEKAKSLALVEPMLNIETSYAGFFTVNPTHNSNMFFWYFPSEFEPCDAPVILWLQGGPGISGLIGLFMENGPFSIENNNLTMKSVYWSQSFHVIYVDNPVGAGFSFSDENGICKDQNCIAENLFSFLNQFYQMFPDLKKNDFYLVGQSYACKYIATFGHMIHTKNTSAKDKINLKGIAIGNGLCDPINMLDHGEHLYQIGLIDDNAKKHFDDVKNLIIKYIKREKWSLAFDAASQLLTLEPMTMSYFRNVTGFTSCFNLLQSSSGSSFDEWKSFIEQDCIRHAIHVGNNVIQSYTRIYLALEEDFMRSVSQLISQLVENYKVLMYSGQLDIIIPYSATVQFLKKLQWSGSKSYRKADRKIWMGKCEDIAGYVKSAASQCTGHLTEVLVRNAGHLVPQDQPDWAYEMICGFIYGQCPFDSPTPSPVKKNPLLLI